LALDESSLRRQPVRDGLRIRVHYFARERKRAPGFIVMLRSHEGVELCRISNMPISGFYIDQIVGDGMVEVVFDALPLTGGRYYVSIGFASRAGRAMTQHWEDVAWFEMAARDLYGSGEALDTRRGYLIVSHRWSHVPATDYAYE
jgi:hypothetical protein